ncbi:MAG: BamA/TamA family outer membrane protein [Saprospiraceae bacterium]|nr:BamA/TamA family outer membrane protein [Saprospiraceae bacterium]
MMPIRRYPFTIIAVATFLLFCGCNTTQFLDKSKGEQYLHKNIIKLNEKKGRIKNKSSLVSELSNLYVERENKKMFRIPRQYFYYVAQDTFDKSRIGLEFSRWLRNRGEDPVFVDTTSANESAAAMESYLITRGYFYADVDYKVESNRDSTKACVTYFVNPDSRYYIDSLEYQSKDTAVLRLLLASSNNSLLKKGSPVDVKLYDQEVARITKLLRDNGYAYFYPQNISNLEGFDSSNVKRTVSIRMKVLTPQNKPNHQKFTVGNIYVYPDYDPNIQGITPDTLIDGLFFGTGGKPFLVKPRTLANSIYLRPGEVYSQEAFDNSVRQLGVLGVFRTPKIVTNVDTTLSKGVMDFSIYLISNKKWEFEGAVNGHLTERSEVLLGRRLLIGPTGNVSLRNRNFLKGAELFISSLNLGAELNILDKKANLLNSLDFNMQNSLLFPRFADYMGIWKRLRKWGVTGPTFNKNLRQKATSRFTAGYNYLLLLGNYKLQFANITFGYDVPVSVNHRVSFNHFGVDVLGRKVIEDSPFDRILKEQPALNASFSPQFITGMFLKDIDFVYTSAPKPTGTSWYFRGFFDLSGLEAMGINALYNRVFDKDVNFKVGAVDFSHYVKLELDGRRYWQFTTNRSLVTRLNLGAATPFYKSSNVPYIKQFFVGGPSSIRGWYTRELGPGLYRNSETSVENRNLFYQAGDLKMEFNIEYRFLMSRPFGMFNFYGAVFLDGGNIWTMKKDDSRPGSQIALKRDLMNLALSTKIIS